MNLRDLAYLVALAQHKHFGKAAESTFVTQPALSMQIKKLEKYLDVQLLERTNKSVLLTEIGMSLAERAKQILLQVEELKTTAKLSKDPYVGELKIGIIPTLAPYLLPHIMPTLSARFPKLNIYLVEKQTDVICEQLQAGKLDAIILALPNEQPGWKTLSLFKETFLLAVSNNHVLANRKKIKQTQLANQTLLLLEDGHCLRDQALSICYMVKANESQHFRATSLETLRHMVASGVGMTLMPKLACQQNDKVSYITFSGAKPLRMIGLQYRATSSKHQVLTDIANLVKQTVSDNNLV